LGKIIQRDFFPDLEKLKAQNEYLDAIANNDIVKLRNIFSKYSSRRPTLSKFGIEIELESANFGSLQAFLSAICNIFSWAC
jgi:hypothetical protein